MQPVPGEANEVQDANEASSGARQRSGIRRVRFRGVVVSIYRKTKKFPYYRVAYRADGKRVLRTFKEYDAALATAEAKARELHAGNQIGASLPKDAALTYRFAMTRLHELSLDMNARKTDAATPDVRLTLDDVITEYIEAKRKIGSIPLIKAVDGYLSTVANLRRVSLETASEEFLKEREARTRPEKEGARPRLSPRMHYQDSLRIKKFRDAFQMDLNDIQARHLDLFFAEHLKAVAPRTRNHFRSTLSVFCRWAVRKGYLPENHGLSKSEGLRPDGKGKEVADVGEVEVYTPDEFAMLLANAEGSLQALVAIGGLAGLRTEELLRLEWPDVWRHSGFILVTGRKAKTRARRLIPVGNALRAWLEPFRQKTEGRLWVHKSVCFHEHMRALHDKVKVPRRANALRHSYVSYRLAEIHNEHQVAAECGTGVAMLHKHYREIVAPSAATAWFSVMPEGAATNVVSVIGKTG